MAFYFSALWALFFYHVFPTPEARLSTAARCFFATGVLSISVLLIAYHLPPRMWAVQFFKWASPFYHIGFTGLYPRRRRGLVLIGLGVPVLSHGLYTSFNSTIIGLGFALLTVLALNLYLARSVEFEEALIERNLTDMP